MLGLLGRVGAQKTAAQPASKRQKRADVLDSLGLGSAAGLRGSGLGLGKSVAVGSTATAKPASNQKVSDEQALQQWLAADEDNAAIDPQPEAESPKPLSSEEPPPEGPPADWRAPFAEATDRWRVDDSTGRVRYFASDQKLYFEWEKEMGVLYQYFPEEEQEATRSEPVRHPVWSADCPETHAEVWEVLPLPPGAPTTEVQTLPPADEELSLDIAEDNEADAHETAGIDKVDRTSSNATSNDASMMPPPALPPRKRPPPPPTFAEASKASAASSSSTSPEQESHVDADSMMQGPQQGPQLPSQQAPAAGEEEEEDDDGADVLQLLGDDSDDEPLEPLGKEDCALPAAPSERVEPTAADLDLDMFAD